MGSSEQFKYDFAISYAGEDQEIAEGIHESIKQQFGGYSIFYAPKERVKLVGQDGESFFEELYQNAKQVIVILSENYKKKNWARFEWDVILERDPQNRFIPVKVDQVKILGLPSNIIYLDFSNHNFQDIAEISIKQLIAFEKLMGIKRATPYEKIRSEIQNSEGALDQAYQLVSDQKARSLLGNIPFPEGDFPISYEVKKREPLNFSRIKRTLLRINVPDGLCKEEIEYNIRHCTAKYFNSEKPDALGIFVYSDSASNFCGFETVFNVAKADFAPYGDWGKAQDGFAYNLPVSKFDWKIQYEESYFDKKKQIKTAQQLADELVLELLKAKKTKGLQLKSKLRKNRD